MIGSEPVYSWLQTVQGKALRWGGIALAASLLGCIIGAFSGSAAPLLVGSYLIGYLFVLGVTLGCMALLMLQHLTGGLWGSTLRRVLEAGSRTMPVVTVLFLPILCGSYQLYPWNHPAPNDHIIAEKRLYLNMWFFVGRAIFYFAIWNLLAFILNRWAVEQETSTSARLARRFRLLSGPGLVLYGFTMTFAAIDWAMSLTPHWYSTIYGVLLIVGQGLNGLVFSIAASLILAKRRELLANIAAETLADLGSLMLAFVMLWAYMSISQLLIIWSGNLPEEITWYLPRFHGGWGVVGLLLAVFHFFVPFFCLLQGRLKRNPQRLIQLAALLMTMRWLDLLWVIGGSLSVRSGAAFLLVPISLIALLGAGGVWLSFFIRQLRSRALTLYPVPALDASDAEAGVPS